VTGVQTCALPISLLGEAPHVEKTDPEAYALYLQARHLGRLGTAEGYEQSIALYQQALAIDPEYPAAWDGLATNYINMAGFGLLPWDEGHAQAREATEKALAIDPDYALAHGTLGWIATELTFFAFDKFVLDPQRDYDNDLAQAARHFERALQLDPADITIIGNAAVLLRSLGRLDESIAIQEYVAARDPVNPIGHVNLGLGYLYAGRWDEAIAAYETTLRLSPGYLGAHYHKGTAQLLKGEFEAALESFAREGDEAWRINGQAIALYALGRQEEHRAKLDELIERWGDQWPSEVAQVYAFMGNADLAFEWLNKAVLAGEPFDPAEPFFQPLANDPRWLPFLESIGKTPGRWDSVEFEVKLPAQ
jgi:tetratricopeptide (TPR) repeat protein